MSDETRAKISQSQRERYERLRNEKRLAGWEREQASDELLDPKVRERLQAELEREQEQDELELELEDDDARPNAK